MTSKSIFANESSEVWRYRWNATIEVTNMAGGFPMDTAVVEGWIKSKFDTNDVTMAKVIAQALADSLETGNAITPDDAIKQLASLKGAKGFKRDAAGLYIESRQVKAALREAASVAANGGHIATKSWGRPDDKRYKKGLKGWFPEHVMVMKDRIPLGRTDADEILTSFCHTAQGDSIKQTEIIYEAVLSFTVITDYDFPEDFWPKLWAVGEQQGIGADRSQGFGRYAVVRWDQQ